MHGSIRRLFYQSMSDRLLARTDCLTLQARLGCAASWRRRRQSGRQGGRRSTPPTDTLTLATMNHRRMNFRRFTTGTDTRIYRRGSPPNIARGYLKYPHLSRSICPFSILKMHYFAVGQYDCDPQTVISNRNLMTSCTRNLDFDHRK